MPLGRERRFDLPKFPLRVWIKLLFAAQYRQFQPLAERFFRTLSDETTFAPTRPLQYSDTTTTAGMAGRMTVVQGLYRDFKIAAFLMEQRVSYNKKLGHLPEIPDRMAFGGQLVRAIARTILD